MASIKKCGNNVWRAQVYTLGRRASASFRTKHEACAWSWQMEAKLRAEVVARTNLEKQIGVGRIEIPADDLLQNRIKAHSKPGIYILFVGDRVTYVGQSQNVMARIASHASKGRLFDSYYVIPCVPDDLDRLERHYIESLTPAENKMLVVGVKAAIHHREAAF